jgi:hypothetical protein
MKLPTLLSFAVLLLAGPAASHAQQYAIAWSTIDGGGGTSTNATYALSGTIGQPDAGTAMTGSVYSVQGGFWTGAYAVQIPDGPFLSIARAGGNVIVSWTPATPGFVLQHSLVLSSNTWQNAASGATNPIAIPAADAARFYRLRAP